MSNQTSPLGTRFRASDSLTRASEAACDGSPSPPALRRVHTARRSCAGRTPWPCLLPQEPGGHERIDDALLSRGWLSGWSRGVSCQAMRSSRVATLTPDANITNERIRTESRKKSGLRFGSPACEARCSAHRKPAGAPLPIGLRQEIASPMRASVLLSHLAIGAVALGILPVSISSCLSRYCGAYRCGTGCEQLESQPLGWPIRRGRGPASPHAATREVHPPAKGGAGGRPRTATRDWPAEDDIIGR